MSLLTGRRTVLVALAVTALTACSSATATPAPPSGAPPSGAGQVTLSLFVDNTQNTTNTALAVVKAFEAKYPNIRIETEVRPQGTEGDQIVKTRLGTDTMNDLFWYNSGSLFQALNPTQKILPITDQATIANLADAFLPTVSAGGKVYGVPWGTALGGGILYNKKIYEQLNLKVPTTWAEFEANNEAIKNAGITPVGQTYGADSTWTSQLFVLADFCNVQAADPTFADDYTNNKAKYATTPAALAGFQHLQEGFDKGWYQTDFGADLFADGLNLLPEGKIAHYPMLSFALATIAADHPDQINDIGYFGQPGTDASKNCSSIWMPGGSYVAATTKHPEEAMLFQEFLASKEGSDTITAAVPPQGPYVTKDAVLPDTVMPAVKDINAYITNNKAAPALEFLSPLKGPSLEQITVAVGSGLTKAEDGAKQYDEDVKKQAQQLGLPGW
jgi:raffinose/stachyose/melibiose transport system substrate-binding protein